MEALWRIDLLGRLCATQDERTITRFRTYKTGSLLGYLAYYLQRPHPREELIELLWPECEPAAGRNSLSTELSSLRHQFEPPGVPKGAVIVADRANVQLNPVAVITDVMAFEAELQAAEQATGDAERRGRLLDAAQLYKGELLPGYYEDWNLAERERLNAAYLRTLKLLAALFERMGEFARAKEYARRAVQADPLDEETHRSLIRLYIELGQSAPALRQYRILERTLAQEFASSPALSTRRLLDRIHDAEALRRQEERPPDQAGTVAGEVAVEVVGTRSPASQLPPLGDEASAFLGTVTYAMVEFETDIRSHEAIPTRGGRAVQQTERSLVVAFGRPSDALAWAILSQSQSKTVRRRIAIFTGETGDRRPATSGSRSSKLSTSASTTALDRAARVLLAAHYDQILCSEATAVLLHRDLEPGIRLLDMGLYRLHGADAPERLFEVDHPGRPPQGFPPPNAEPGYRDALPLQFTRFFGRAEEIARLRSLLTPAVCRLVTLTGPGGIGKTRLALEVARSLLEPYRGRIWFVPLADVDDPQRIPDAIHNALRLPRSPTVDPWKQVIAFLRSPGADEATLLVLDNFEQLVRPRHNAAADGVRTVRTLLEQAPSLTCLVTSRRRLGVSGERELTVPPLSTPIPPSQAEASSLSLEQLAPFSSVQLFVDRAQSMRPDFQITPRNASVVAALCERLEGLPLAIELAAARAQVLTAAQMLAQLERRFDLLATRRIDKAARHRSLWAAQEWSYDLLGPELRQFFARLSVFRGGWTVEAAEEVCEESSALDEIARLRDCSLIVAEEEDTDSDEMRFRMLETLREFALEKLEADERAALLRRHSDYFLALAEKAEPHLVGPKQAAWLSQLEREYANLRAALDWCSEKDTAEKELRLCGALGRFWLIRGYWSEGRERLAHILSHVPETGHEAERAKASLWASTLAYSQGDYTEAGAAAEESLMLSRKLGNQREIADALNNLGNAAYGRGDSATAHTLYEECLAIRRTLSDLHGIAALLNNLGNLASERSDDAAARTLLEESLTIRRSLGEQRGIASSLHNLVIPVWSLGERAVAQEMLEESLSLRRELGDRSGITYCLCHQGFLWLHEAEYEAAHAAFEEGLMLGRTLGGRSGFG